MQVSNQRDFLSGLLFVASGLAFVFLSREYAFGTPARMGPGFFPTMLGALLTLLGLIVVWRSLSRDGETVRLEAVGWRQFGLILAALLLFALALPRFGLVIAITLLIGVGASATPEFRTGETAISIVVLLLVAWLVFIRGLGLQLTVWPAFLLD